MQRLIRQALLLLFLAMSTVALHSQIKSPYPPLFKGTKYSVGAQPVSVVAADFNGDGKPDIATVNRGSSTVSILINKGDGTFQNRVDYATGTEPSQVVTGDFNNDGKADLAVANGGDGSISILLGNGDGTFRPAIETFIATGPTLSLSAFDFDGDGKLDLVVGPADVSLLGKGDGTFQAPLGFSLYNGGTLSYVLVTFLSNSFDLVGVMNDFPPFEIEELSAQGKAKWLNYADVIPSGPYTHLGQLAGGKNQKDTFGLVAASWTDQNQVFLCAPNLDNVLGCSGNYNVGKQPIGIALGDLTGDGLLDMVTANSGSNNISFLRGHTDIHKLGPRKDYAAGKVPVSVIVADFDGNGRADVAVANSGEGTVTTLLQSTAALSAFSLSFGKQTVGTTSAAKTITLFNAGAATLHISGISVSGDFNLQSNECGATLSSGTSCKVGIVFQPRSAGVRKGTLSFYDDALGSVQTVSLSGKGI